MDFSKKNFFYYIDFDLSNRCENLENTTETFFSSTCFFHKRSEYVGRKYENCTRLIPEIVATLLRIRIPFIIRHK